jgi:large subunit ribosomal protein L3
MGKRAHHPKRGSLGYSPRKRAASPIPRIRSWVEEDRVRMQGFVGYKAGTTHVIMIDDFPHSPTYGEEIKAAATVIETPPVKVCGVRAYEKNTTGLRVISEVWEPNPSKDLKRALPLPKKLNHSIDNIEKVLDKTEELRLLIHTQPRNSATPRKKPEIMEYKISGDLNDGFEYAQKVLGKELKVSDIFEEGEFLDVISITKGKGFQSPVKKWGVKHLPRKTRKGHRTAGTLGPWHPAAMMWTVPQSGKMGYHQRTEYNKRILKIGSREDEITPKGGFLGYGVVSGDFLLLHGSIPGPRNRLVRLRPAIKPPSRMPAGPPQLVYISRSSKQGA